MEKNHNLDKMKSEVSDKNSPIKPITKSMMIAEVVDEYPDTIAILIENGMHCIGCGASMFETLEDGFVGHGMGDTEIDKIMEELNDYVRKNPKN